MHITSLFRRTRNCYNNFVQNIKHPVFWSELIKWSINRMWSRIFYLLWLFTQLMKRITNLIKQVRHYSVCYLSEYFSSNFVHFHFTNHQSNNFFPKSITMYKLALTSSLVLLVLISATSVRTTPRVVQSI